MLPDTAEAILGVIKALLKTCGQYIQEIWYKTKALRTVTTAKHTKWLHDDVTAALNMFLQHIHRHGVIAEIYSRAATWEDVNDMVLFRCGENHIWWVVWTLGRRWLENTELQMLRWNRDISDDDDDNGNGNLTHSGQEMGAHTSHGKEPVLPGQHGEHNNNHS